MLDLWLLPLFLILYSLKLSLENDHAFILEWMLVKVNYTVKSSLVPVYNWFAIKSWKLIISKNDLQIIPVCMHILYLSILDCRIHIGLLRLIWLIIKFQMLLSKAKDHFPKRKKVLNNVYAKSSIKNIDKLISRGHENPVSIPSNRFKISQIIKHWGEMREQVLGIVIKQRDRVARK